MTGIGLGALIAVSALVIGALALDLRRLPARLIARQAHRFAEQVETDLAFVTITAHLDEEPQS